MAQPGLAMASSHGAGRGQPDQHPLRTLARQFELRHLLWQAWRAVAPSHGDCQRRHPDPSTVPKHGTGNKQGMASSRSGVP